MKRILVSVAAAALIGVAATGCGSSADSGASASAEPASAATRVSAAASSSVAAAPGATLTEQDGKLVDRDPQAGVVEGTGFDITIDPAAQTALFQTIDPSTGDAFQNSALFDYANGTFVRHVFVSATGSAYVYTCDLATGELQMVQNAAGEDVSEAVRGQGRWESAGSGSATQRADIEKYFEARYGMTVEQAATA